MWKKFICCFRKGNTLLLFYGACYKYFFLQMSQHCFCIFAVWIYIFYLVSPLFGEIFGRTRCCIAARVILNAFEHVHYSTAWRFFQKKKFFNSSFICVSYNSFTNAFIHNQWKAVKNVTYFICWWKDCFVYLTFYNVAISGFW